MSSEARGPWFGPSGVLIFALAPPMPRLAAGAAVVAGKRMPVRRHAARPGGAGDA